jgi:hypothetical protein
MVAAHPVVAPDDGGGFTMTTAHSGQDVARCAEFAPARAASGSVLMQPIVRPADEISRDKPLDRKLKRG